MSRLRISVFYQNREPLSLGFSLPERVLIAARALFFYAGKLLWPAELAVIYPHWDVDASELLSWGFVAAAMAVPALLWAFRRQIGLGPLVGAAFFAVTLSPVLGFVDYGYMQFSFVADRYQYLAGCGFLAVLVAAGAHGAGRLGGGPRKAVHAVAMAVLAMLAAKTWTQGRVYRDEITLFQHIVSVNPSARDAHLNLASALATAGRLEESAAASRIALEQRPDSAKAHTNLGRALAGLGRFEEAEEALRKARELDARDEDIVQNTAEMLRKAGRYEEALEQFREALAMEPDHALAYAGMGDTLFRLGRHEEALDAIAKALSLQPNLPMAGGLQRLSGEAAWKLNDLEKATYHFQLALEADPDDTEIHLNLGKLSLEQQRFEEANKHLRRAVELRPGDSMTLLKVGDALRIGGLQQESLASYREVLSSSPNSAPAHAGMGLALFELERYAESIEELNEALELDSEMPIKGALHRHLGRTNSELGDFEEAVDHFRRAIEADPSDRDSTDRLALLFFERKRFQDALGHYLALAELQPESAQTHANTGATLVHLGRDEEAIQAFERALALDPELAGVRTTLENLRRKVGIPQNR